MGTTRTTGPEGTTVTPPRRPNWRRRLGVVVFLIIALPVLAFALWTWGSLTFSFSHGDRAGYVQKFSRRGWVCKTWEGELAMVNLPGAMPEIFQFTVRDKSVAEKLNTMIGQRVVLTYDQHKGLPSSCFGETEYFITDVRPADPLPQ